MFCKAKSAKKNYFFLFGNFRPLPNYFFEIWDPFFSLLFSRDSKSLKILDIRLQEVGAKRRLNGTSKVNTLTETRTNRRTNQLIEMHVYFIYWDMTAMTAKQSPFVLQSRSFLSSIVINCMLNLLVQIYALEATLRHWEKIPHMGDKASLDRCGL